MLRGSAWMVAMRWSMRFIGLISTAILARLLDPQDFGLVAMGTLVLGLLEVFFELGTAQLLIRIQDAKREHYDTAWTIVLIQSFLLAAGLYALAPWAAAYYGEPRVESVIRWLALASVAQGLSNIATVDFRKNLDFAKDFRFELYARLSGFILTVALAFTLRSYWALVIAMIAGGVARSGFSYLMHPFRPRLSLVHWRQFLTFSMWVTPGSVANYLNNRLDSFVIGAVNTAAQLGIYHVASEMSRMVTSELAIPIQRALFPAFAIFFMKIGIIAKDLRLVGGLNIEYTEKGLSCRAISPMSCLT